MSKDLTVQTTKDLESITSLEVAEMVGRTHDKVIRDIRNIIEQIGNTKVGESYFEESTYVNSQNKVLPMYLLTKKGCELYATRMTGAKGTQFAVAYIEKFNELQEENNRLAIDNQDLHQIAVSDEHQEKRQYQADVIRYSWGNIRTLLEQSDYKTIENEVDKILDFHTNKLKKKDRAKYKSHQSADKTEYKQIVRDRVFEVLENIHSTTLDAVLRTVTGELRLELTQDKLSTHKRSTGRVIANKDKEIDSLKPPSLDEYFVIHKHPFSQNYRNTATTDVNGNPIMVNTGAYESWKRSISAFNSPKKSELGVDFSKPMRLYLMYDQIETMDTTNFEKPVLDKIAELYGFDDVLIQQIGKPETIVNKFVDSLDEGKIYFLLRNVDDKEMAV